MSKNRPVTPSQFINPKRQTNKSQKGVGLSKILGKKIDTLPLQEEDQEKVNQWAREKDPLHNVRGKLRAKVIAN